MPFKFRLVSRIENMSYYRPDWDFPEYLHQILCQQSRLVGVIPDAFPFKDFLWNVWEYELTDQQQLIMDVAGAQTHHLWHKLRSKTVYINRRICIPCNNSHKDKHNDL